MITAHSPNLSPCRRTGIPLTPSQVPQPGGTVTSVIIPPQPFPAEQNWLSQGAEFSSFSSQHFSPRLSPGSQALSPGGFCHRDVAVLVQSPDPCAVGRFGCSCCPFRESFIQSKKQKNVQLNKLPGVLRAEGMVSWTQRALGWQSSPSDATGSLWSGFLPVPVGQGRPAGICWVTNSFIGSPAQS